MNVVQVIPITAGVGRDHLTYFSAKEISPGALVTIPLRNRLVPGLVIQVEPATKAKSQLRQANHSLKKIKDVKAKRFLSPAVLRAAEKAADYFAAPLGSMLESLLPITLLKESDKLDPGTISDGNTSPFKPERRVLQDTDEQRLSFYKSLIREQFAQNASVLLCLPTVADINEVIASLGKGIGDYTFVLHNRLTKRALIQAWNAATTSAHPILAVVTPAFLSLPRNDFKTLIVDRESSSAYKAPARPFTDYRTFAEFLVAQYGAKLIFGDIYVRTETLARVTSGELVALSGLKQRLISTAENVLLPAQNGEVLTAESKQLIAHAQAEHERTFILANRRGLAPLVVCDDCGQPVVCERCQTTMVLHQANLAEKLSEHTTLVCHRCKHRQSARMKCPHCQSWRLRALGSGSEKIAAEVANNFPAVTVWQLDSDQVSTPKQAAEVINNFLAAPGSVLVGTELALYYLKEKIENVLVVAADSLLSLPDFRMRERLFGLLVRARSLATKFFVVQTRYLEDPLFNNLLAGNLINFYRQEIEERKNFSYPPFSRLIKITAEGEKDAVRRELKKVSEELADYEPMVYPAFHTGPETKYRANLLLRLRPADWPKEELLAKLRGLSPALAVNVDPQDIL